MDFKDVLASEHATRKFTDQIVSEKTVIKVIEEAQRTPSLLNSQPWRSRIVAMSFCEPRS